MLFWHHNVNREKKTDDDNAILLLGTTMWHCPKKRRRRGGGGRRGELFSVRVNNMRLFCCEVGNILLIDMYKREDNIRTETASTMQ